MHGEVRIPNPDAFVIGHIQRPPAEYLLLSQERIQWMLQVGLKGLFVYSRKLEEDLNHSGCHVDTLHADGCRMDNN